MQIRSKIKDRPQFSMVIIFSLLLTGCKLYWSKWATAVVNMQDPKEKHFKETGWTYYKNTSVSDDKLNSLFLLRDLVVHWYKLSFSNGLC